MLEGTVQDWMAAPMAGEGQAAAESEIVRDMAGSCELGSLTFPAIIEDLEPYVGADQEDLILVARGLALLPLILQYMTVEAGTRQDVNILVTYLCLRLKNDSEVSNFRYGLDQIADSLLVLIQWKKFLPGDVVNVSNAIFSLAQGSNSTFIDLTPSTRLKFYNIIRLLVDNHERHIERDMGKQSFVEGLVELSELEKSAICLKDLFALYAKIGNKWTLQPDGYTKLWDCFIRYFPITLGASQKEDQPKPEELKDLLRQCFTANDFYAEAAFETLLGNIDADQGANKKKEILMTLKACTKRYSISKLLVWGSKIWDTIKFEIWSGENDEFILDSLHILNSLFSTLSNSPWSWEESTAFSKLVDSVVKEIFERFSDIQRYVAGSTRMLLAIGSSSSVALHLVLKQILPGLISMAQDEHAKVPRKSVIGVFNSIFQARVDLAEDASTYEEQYHADPVSLRPSIEWRAQEEIKLVEDIKRFRGPLTDLFFGLMADLKTDSNADPALSAAVIQGLVLLVRFPSLFLTEKGAILEALNEVTLNTTNPTELQFATLNAIREIAKFDSAGFKDITLPKFMKQLPDSIRGEDQPGASHPESEMAMRLLENLVLIGCTSSANHDILQSGILNKFAQVRSGKGQIIYLNILIAGARRALWLFDSSLPAGPCEARILNPLDINRGPYAHIILPFLDCIVGVNTKETNGDGPSYIGLQNMCDPSQPYNDFTIDMLGQMITIAMLSEFYELDRDTSDKSDVPEALKKSVHKRVDNILVTWNRSQPEGTPSAILTLFRTGHELDRAKDSLDSQFNFGAWPIDRALATFLTVSLLAGMNPKTPNYIGFHIGDVADAMIQGSIAHNEHLEGSKLAKVSMLSLLQLLVNKFGAGKTKSSKSEKTVLQTMLDAVDSQPLLVATHKIHEAENVYRTLAYFTAASLAAYSADAVPQLISRMLGGITLEKYGHKVAQSFRILLAPSSILNKQNFCIIRPLRKGRLFELAAKKLIEMWRSEQTSVNKANCLVALAGILAYMEPATLHENVKLIFPAVLEGTNIVNDEWVKATYLQTIFTLISLAPKTIESHLDSVINRMTDRTHNTYDSPSDSSVKCRVMALEILQLLVEHVDTGMLVQRKFRLVAELDIALDDVSRDVRAKAARCKISWFNLS